MFKLLIGHKDYLKICQLNNIKCLVVFRSFASANVMENKEAVFEFSEEESVSDDESFSFIRRLTSIIEEVSLQLYFSNILMLKKVFLTALW